MTRLQRMHATAHWRRNQPIRSLEWTGPWFNEVGQITCAWVGQAMLRLDAMRRYNREVTP